LRAFLPPAETRTSRATDRGRRSESAAADITRVEAERATMPRAWLWRGADSYLGNGSEFGVSWPLKRLKEFSGPDVGLSELLHVDFSRSYFAAHLAMTR
jgi:hypothetical protein